MNACGGSVRFGLYILVAQDDLLVVTVLRSLSESARHIMTVSCSSFQVAGPANFITALASNEDQFVGDPIGFD